MEKWFKDFINKKVEASKKEVTNPKNVVETVLKNPENYSKRTNSIAQNIKKRGGTRNA
tara:strand:- start:266 stop:439 length:174 start_codon:yes stop_codon:yes gene_type:complete